MGIFLSWLAFLKGELAFSMTLEFDTWQESEQHGPREHELWSYYESDFLLLTCEVEELVVIT